MPKSSEILPTSTTKKIKVVHKKLHDISRRIFGMGRDTFFLERMRIREADGYYRKTMFGAELIWDTCKLSFDKKVTTKKDRKALDKSKKNLFVFSMVKNNGVKYLLNNKLPARSAAMPVVYNGDYCQSTKAMCATDVDGAYWKIALQMGVISKKTYDKGIDADDKNLCVAALSCLGSDKTYHRIKKGVLTDELIVLKGDDNLKKLYHQIRYACFNHMKTLADTLGDDFIAYKTDCIYYKYSARNKRMVEKYLDDNGLDFKTEKVSAPSSIKNIETSS